MFYPIDNNLSMFFFQKNCLLSSQKYGLGIRDPEILIQDPDPGVKIAPGPRYRIRNTAD
jgi:hypothetical protein